MAIIIIMAIIIAICMGNFATHFIRPQFGILATNDNFATLVGTYAARSGNFATKNGHFATSIFAYFSWFATLG